MCGFVLPPRPAQISFFLGYYQTMYFLVLHGGSCAVGSSLIAGCSLLHILSDYVFPLQGGISYRLLRVPTFWLAAFSLAILAAIGCCGIVSK